MPQNKSTRFDRFRPCKLWLCDFTSFLISGKAFLSHRRSVAPVGSNAVRGKASNSVAEIVCVDI